MYKRILLCFDGSVPGRIALKEAIELVVSLGAEAHVLGIAQTPALVRSAAAASGTPCFAYEEEARHGVEELIHALQQHGLKAQGHCVSGRALDQIPAFARRLQCDLVVITHRPRAGLGRWWSPGDGPLLLDRTPCHLMVMIDRS